MAWKQLPFYNVDYSVGPGRANQMGDVMLVQYFLREFYNHPDFRHEKPQGDMIIDGRFGPTTELWIRAFQSNAASRGRPIHVDGRVDPAVGGFRGGVTSGGKYYTIAHFNFAFRKRYQFKHDHLESAAGVPATLQAQLREGLGSA